MLFINSFQVVLFLFLVIEKGISIFFPNFSLFGVDFLFINLFLSFLFYLPSKILSHLSFLLFSYSFASFLLFFLFSKLIVNMSHHFLIFSPNLFFLIFDYRVGKWGHYCFNFFLAFSFFFLSLSFKLIL